MKSVLLICLIFASVYTIFPRRHLADSEKVDCAKQNINPDGRCGKDYGICKSGTCSEFNWCGDGDAWVNDDNEAYNSIPQCVAEAAAKNGGGAAKKEGGDGKKKGGDGKKEGGDGKKKGGDGKKEDGAGKKEDGAAKKEDGAAKKEDGAAKKEDGAGKKEDGAGKKKGAAAKKEDGAGKKEGGKAPLGWSKKTEGLKSQVENTPIALHFENKLATATVVNWLDYNGKKVKYQTLAADGGANDQPTYLDHAWQLESGDKILGTYTAPDTLAKDTNVYITITTDGVKATDSDGKEIAGWDTSNKITQSRGTNAPVALHIQNNRFEKVTLLWIDFQGDTKAYQTIKAGESSDQPTYVAHAWTFTKDNIPFGSYTVPAHLKANTTENITLSANGTVDIKEVKAAAA